MLTAAIIVYGCDHCLERKDETIIIRDNADAKGECVIDGGENQLHIYRNLQPLVREAREILGGIRCANAHDGTAGQG